MSYGKKQFLRSGGLGLGTLFLCRLRVHLLSLSSKREITTLDQYSTPGVWNSDALMAAIKGENFLDMFA